MEDDEYVGLLKQSMTVLWTLVKSSECNIAVQTDQTGDDASA